MDHAFLNLGFIDGLGGPEMVLIFVLILVLFGGEKLPEFARGLGKSIREFKKAAANVEDEFKRALDEDERKRQAAALPPPAVSALPAHETAYGSDPALHDPSHPDYHYHDGSTPDYPGPGPAPQPTEPAASPATSNPVAGTTVATPDTKAAATAVAAAPGSAPATTPGAPTPPSAT